MEQSSNDVKWARRTHVHAISKPFTRLFAADM